VDGQALSDEENLQELASLRLARELENFGRDSSEHITIVGGVAIQQILKLRFLLVLVLWLIWLVLIRDFSDWYEMQQSDDDLD